MNSSGMSAICDDFGGESDDLKDDNDFGELGSILSWDDPDDDEGDAERAIRGRNAASSAPPDLVEFSDKGGVPQFSFLENQQKLPGGLTLTLPLPTPISNIRQQQSTKAPAPATKAPAMKMEETPKAPPQPAPSTQVAAAPPPAQAPQQQQQQQIMATPANFAQLLAQQAGALLQQQQQQATPVPASKDGQPLSLRPALPTGQAIQQTQPPGQTAQQQPAIQFTSDPNALLQQIQIAQLQQQLQAAQQQQVAQARTQQQQLANPLQQMQIQFTVPPAVSQKPLGPPPVVPAKLSKTLLEESKRKAKAAPKDPPAVTSTMPSKIAVNTVSASDTDGESSKPKPSKAAVVGSGVTMAAKPTKLEPIDMSTMTASEKAKANRDRNREHARNTRLRKKAYLEKLKTTVDELCRERDTLVSERASAANLLVEMHNTRTEVLMSFFALRTSNEKRRKLWSSILDESFMCQLPVTPYRSFPASEVQISKCLRTIMGIDGLMADTASLHALFDTLVDRSKHLFGKISFRYTLVTEETVVAGNQMMARWVMSTTNAIENGAKTEVAKQGMLCCKFNSAHKIVGLELMFDVMAFMLQVKHAAGSDGFSVVPNTVQTCQRSFDKPMVLTLAESPYTIVQVNRLWEDMTGIAADEVVGKTSCSILHCNDTNKEQLKLMMQEVRFKRSTTSMLMNKAKSGEKFWNFIALFPLSTDSRITYYLGLTLFHERKSAIKTEATSDEAPPTKRVRLLE